MSLTSELRDAGSPIRAYLDGISPILAASRGKSDIARAKAAELGLVDLEGSALLAPAPAGVNKPLSGTAFDIRARIELGGFDPAASTSASGVLMLDHIAPAIENGPHRAQVLREAFKIGELLLHESENSSDLTRASVLFAYCEQVYRAGEGAFGGALGEACNTVKDGRELVEAIPDATIADVETLLKTNRSQIEAWGKSIADGERFEPNPSFSGARLLGGADGDWMVGDTLIDCKVYESLSTTKLRDFLRQLLGYVMLDLEDALAIRTIGVWLPRQQKLKTWSLEHLLGDDPETLLPKLREGFLGATARNQIAVHVPISERRKLQLLADNRHTPYPMLIALAQGDDKDLRFRVGRNTATPTNIVRELAQDRYAVVREGVAKNTAAPSEVLERLLNDRSLIVRRAAEKNLSTTAATVTQQPHVLMPSHAAATSAESSVRDVIPAETRTTELVAHPVAINQDRSTSAHRNVVFGPLLQAVLSTPDSRDLNRHLPLAGRIWAYKCGRSLQVPARAKEGLPLAIISDLMSEERTPYTRLLASRGLRIADTEIRQRLFADHDPSVRMDGLERSLHEPDPLLGEILAELSSSRDARITFATSGLKKGERWSTPTESSDQVARIVARHPATPTEALKALVAEKSVEVQLALASNPALSEESMTQLTANMMGTKSRAAHELFAASPHTPPAVLGHLAGSRDAHIRALVASNPATSVNVLSQLGHDAAFGVRLAVITNSRTPMDLATSVVESLLLTSEDRGLELYEVLRALTRLPDAVVSDDLVVAVLDRLSKSRVRTPNVRHFAASHRQVSVNSLERLARSKDPDVRIAVSWNPRTPQSILELLAADSDPDVRWNVAGNRRLPQDALNALLLDADTKVRIAAYRAPDSEANDEESSSTEVINAAEATRMSIEQMREMAASTRAEVRTNVAYRDDVPPDILAFLGGERRSKKVRQAVAAHPSTPPEVLKSLGTKSDPDTLLLAAFNPGAPVDLLADLAGRSVELALIVALNPDAPLEVLEALANDSDLFVAFVAQAQIETRGRQVDAEDAERVADAGPPRALEV